MIYWHHMIFKLNYKTCVLIEIELVNVAYVCVFNVACMFAL